MAVRRILPNLAAPDPAALQAFYRRVFALEPAMDMGWIVTLAGPGTAPPQLSLVAPQGETPALTIEVDDLDAVLDRAAAAGVRPEYGPAREGWGVRRAFLRDPAGNLLNVMVHEAP
jgi:catechol 2,3-dioxygenase-like lactoylglutathione lyase family enzyme